MTSCSVGVHCHLPHTFILLSLLRALSSSELSAGRMRFTSLALLWVRAGEGVYYIINPSSRINLQLHLQPTVLTFLFWFLYRESEKIMLVWGCVLLEGFQGP